MLLLAFISPLDPLTMHCLGHAQDFLGCNSKHCTPVLRHLASLFHLGMCVLCGAVLIVLKQHLLYACSCHHFICQVCQEFMFTAIVSPEFSFCYTVRYWAGGCDVWCSIACDPCKGVSALGADVWWGWCLQDNLSLKAQGGAELQCSAAAFCVGHHRQILDTFSTAQRNAAIGTARLSWRT